MPPSMMMITINLPVIIAMVAKMSIIVVVTNDGGHHHRVRCSAQTPSTLSEVETRKETVMIRTQQRSSFN